LFIGDVGDTATINVLKSCALNPKFQHFLPIFKKILSTMNLKLERRAPNRSKQGHFTKNSSRKEFFLSEH
jgi:hypothetical protein